MFDPMTAGVRKSPHSKVEVRAWIRRRGRRGLSFIKFWALGVFKV
jgi:hypothetical protein|tara:strand:- start:888 stop:1022 length:135 start_codon:yes stop_codon:yes gene_type:complete